MRNGEHFSMQSPFSTVLFKKDGSLVRLVGASHMSLITQIWMPVCCFWRNICLQQLWWACNFPGIQFSTWWQKCNMEVESLTTWTVSFSLHMLPSGWSKGCLDHHSPSTLTARITTTISQKAVAKNMSCCDIIIYRVIYSCIFIYFLLVDVGSRATNQAPWGLDMGNFQQHIESVPAVDSPLIFGLHPNADITYRLKEASEMLTTIIETQPKDSSASVPWYCLILNLELLTCIFKQELFYMFTFHGDKSVNIACLIWVNASVCAKT